MADFIINLPDQEADEFLSEGGGEPEMIEEEETAESGLEYITPERALGMGNLALHLSEETLNEIGEQVHSDYEADKSSRSDWSDKYRKAMDYAKQRSKPKSTPWENSSNVVYPLLTKSSLQFAARAGKALMPGRNLVKPADGIGDPTRIKAARNASTVVNSAFMFQKNWRKDTDRLLHHTPVAGVAFRKVWWDNGVQSKWCTADNVVVNMSFDGAEIPPRLSEVLPFNRNEIISRIRKDIWADTVSPDELSAREDGDVSTETFLFVEQHTSIDLDGDGYAEPYVVTFVEETGDVVAIYPRFSLKGILKNDRGEIAEIIPRNHYVKYPFIPDAENSFYDVGFGQLLGPINAAVNTTINQLLDAGTLVNMPGGFFGRGLRHRGQELSYTPGRFKPLDIAGQDIAQNIYHMEFREPSGVIFNLLSFLVAAGEDISSVKDIMTGGTDLNLAPTTVMAMVEQGTKQFNAIFDRHKQALTEEAGVVAALLFENLSNEDYKKIVGDEDADISELSPEMMRFVQPEADEMFASDQVRAMKAQYYQQLVGVPTIDPFEAQKRALVMMDDPNPEELLAKPSNPEDDPQYMLDKQRADNDTIRARATALKSAYEGTKLQAEAIKAIAQAEGEEAGRQLEIYKGFMEKIAFDEQRRLGRLDGNGNVPGVQEGAGEEAGRASEQSSGNAGGTGGQGSP